MPRTDAAGASGTSARPTPTMIRLTLMARPVPSAREMRSVNTPPMYDAIPPVAITNPIASAGRPSVRAT